MPLPILTFVVQHALRTCVDLRSIAGRCMLAVAILAFVIESRGIGQSLPEIRSEELASAWQRGMERLLCGAENYPRHRDCFSCHHQTMPLLAMSKYGEFVSTIDPLTKKRLRTVRKEITEFTISSFEPRQADLLAGNLIEGKALTVGYGLWALDLALQPRSELTDAMTTYLIETQHADGYWEFHSLRPPASSSRWMTTALALRGLQRYASADVDCVEAVLKAWRWVQKTTPDETNEEWCGYVWCRLMLEADEGAVSKLEDVLWSRQRSDGGWSQQSNMESDAYATGQSLVLLAQLQKEEFRIPQEPRFRKGIRYLLDHQEADGSWHVVSRAKPVQEYFDNGDPHGTDQFISITATGWATAAIGLSVQQEAVPASSAPESKELP